MSGLTYHRFVGGRMVRLPGSPTCPTCEGDGERGGIDCPDCDGTGRVRWTDDDLDRAAEQAREGWAMREATS